MSAEDIEYMDDYKEFPTKESALDWLDNYLSLDERNNLIKVLEQEPILDKIRAEIAALKSNHINDCYDDGFQGCRTNVLHILDKYKTEIEPQESEDI